MKRYLTFLIVPIVFSCTTPETEDAVPSTEFLIDGSTITNEFELGRVLFYDKKLSINNSVSCGSCHKQAFAFADNVALSPGFENRLGTRNTMPIQNLGSGEVIFDDVGNVFFSSQLFWDGRESSLTNMVLKPVVNHREMGITDVDGLTEKLSRFAYYQESFNRIYGTDVTLAGIANSMVAFVSSINSRNTKFDDFMFAPSGLSNLELQGMELFFDTYDCNSCHQVTDPSGYFFAGTFANIGLDQVYDDKGRGEVTGAKRDNGSFKIPSLRNVSLTAPYMHDGRFNTLDEVIEHYSTGIKSSESLDFRLRDEAGAPKVFDISEQDKKAIVAFLNTLTDFEMVSNPKFSDPFKIR